MMNERIFRLGELVVINSRGENLGTMDARAAYDLARKEDLDIVVVNLTARPPVARILDYGKYQYEQEKREKESSKKSTKSELKGIRLRPGTDEHDVNTKLKNAIRFLQEGDKVKVTVTFRSREITRPEMGRRVLQQFVDGAVDVAIVEKDPKMEGRMMSLILSPKPGAARARAHQDAPPAEETTSEEKSAEV